MKPVDDLTDDEKRVVQSYLDNAIRTGVTFIDARHDLVVVPDSQMLSALANGHHTPTMTVRRPDGRSCAIYRWTAA